VVAPAVDPVPAAPDEATEPDDVDATDDEADDEADDDDDFDDELEPPLHAARNSPASAASASRRVGDGVTGSPAGRV
jgi:hypothetical protein